MEKYFEVRAKESATVTVGRNVIHAFLKLHSKNPARDRPLLGNAFEALKGRPKLVWESVVDPAPEETLYQIIEQMI
eukprot:8527293-Karenia_brevis.AAC.1